MTIQSSPVRKVGRYEVLDELAAGGMARVHLGRLSAEGGFSRVVAIKVLHAQYARDLQFRAMFLDEARLVGRIRHPNVVSTLDVLEAEGELFLVMDYVHGVPLSHALMRSREMNVPVPVAVAVSIMLDVLEGLHAAHEACAEGGTPLKIVHRDVSPQNIMVGDDGVAHVVDFGVAHAVDRLHRTVPGQIKGKAAYMAPEQATGEEVDRRVDLYAAAIVLWECLVGQRLFNAGTFAATVLQQLQTRPQGPSTLRAGVPTELDEVVLRGLEKWPKQRFDTARKMASALERAAPRAPKSEVAEWLHQLETEFFSERDALLTRIGRGGAPRMLPPDAETVRAPAVTPPAMIREAVSSGPPTMSRRVVGVLLAFAVLLGTVLIARGVGRNHASVPTGPPQSVDVKLPPEPARAEPSTVASASPPVPSESAPAPVASTKPTSPAVLAHGPRPVAPPSVASAASSPAPAPSHERDKCCNPLGVYVHDDTKGECEDNCRNSNSQRAR